MNMYCYQCEQTAKGEGCQIQGVCGKQATSADLQDEIVSKIKELAFYANKLRQSDYINKKADMAMIEGLFTTVTNVNFDDIRLKRVKETIQIQINELKELANFDYTPMSTSVLERKALLGEDIHSLHEIITYGLKGAAAYYDHAKILGYEDDKLVGEFFEVLDFLNNKNATSDELLAKALQVGEINFKVMQLLDDANTSTYGHPEPTRVRVTPIKGKAIVVSGHDLKDLEELLKQTEGTGINVYTHGEMLPCNAYPGLKKYAHLVGNYGGAWQDQQKEFKEFPGAILMTTNCIQNPQGYSDRIFTTGLVAWPNVKHVHRSDFSAVIEAALKEKGFEEDDEEKYITIGFGRNSIISIAPTVVKAVKAGQIRHFFLIGGCDGAKSGRNYYTEFAQKVPQDCVILTLACGKYRFNKLEFGDIGGIPRLLDVGQCNDAYSAIKIALALSEAFEKEVNDLPLSMILSWYEQKAVAILLTLLYLGIKNIRLGPSLPAFITSNVLNILVEKYNIKPITTPDEDLKAILG
ncbi:MAG: hydroxylamine reductase [Candidatus Gastranaerophilales bacterium]|nr:hydroxylamine reductase [Candidatus Gastranaerophilales bacterium]